MLSTQYTDVKIMSIWNIDFNMNHWHESKAENSEFVLP